MRTTGVGTALSAGVVVALSGAGVSPKALRWWWRQPREELGGEPPRAALIDGRASDVLALARDDAARLQEHVLDG